ncbi:MAG: transposase family protein [Desulfovibrio desulfuricans]|jgi:transposase InsO family protein|nr:transposase family protein [Desulfovibrio desulfuricans]
MDTTLVLEALKKAYEARRPPHGLRLHSDRGSQYCSKAYQQQLAAYRMQQQRCLSVVFVREPKPQIE